MSDKNKGTSEMPVPNTINYSQEFKVTPLFKSDLRIVLKDAPYIEVNKLFEFIDAYNSIFTSAILNEFLKSLASFPYSTIYPLMKAIEQKDNFGKYFELIKK